MESGRHTTRSLARALGTRGHSRCDTEEVIQGAAQQEPPAGPEPEGRGGQETPRPPRRAGPSQPPGCRTEGHRGSEALRGTRKGCAPGRAHTHTSAYPACTQGTDALPRGLLTMVTEWPPLSPSHHLKVSKASCARRGSTNKDAARGRPGRGSAVQTSQRMPATLPRGARGHRAVLPSLPGST